MTSAVKRLKYHGILGFCSDFQTDGGTVLALALNPSREIEVTARSFTTTISSASGRLDEPSGNKCAIHGDAAVTGQAWFEKKPEHVESAWL